MPTAEAHVRTDRPSRYLIQLCRHASQMGQQLRHRPRSHDSGDAPPEVRHVEWSDTHGIVTLNCGRWTMQATPGTLGLRAEAADTETLRRIQDLLAARLGKIGRRENLKVTWQPTHAPAPLPGDATGPPPAPIPQAVARRSHRTTIGLTTAGALAIAVHLGLGGTTLASARWTGMAADIVLAALGLKVAAVTAIALRRRRATRGH